jgi:excisionase family DNA binding protein
MKRINEQSVEEAPIWTIPETARYLKVSVEVVKKMIHDGKLPYQRLGLRNVIPIDAVKKYLADGWKVRTVPASKDDCPQPLQATRTQAA